MNINVKELALLNFCTQKTTTTTTMRVNDSTLTVSKFKKTVGIFRMKLSLLCNFIV